MRKIFFEETDKKRHGLRVVWVDVGNVKGENGFLIIFPGVPVQSRESSPHSGWRNRGRTLRNGTTINPASQFCLPWFILNTAFIAQFRLVLYIKYL